jgi:hypothetical protein
MARMSCVLTSPPSFQIGELLGTQHRLQLGRRLARLRAVGLVCNHGKALALGGRQIADGVDRERKGLDGADDDFLVAGEGFGELAALAPVLAGDRRHDAADALEIEEGFLELVVDHRAVGNHQHRVEDLVMIRVVLKSSGVLFMLSSRESFGMTP